MMFLIPAFVVDQDGSPADAGAVMALAGALALTGPFVGNLADRFGAHRAVQLTGIAMCGGAAVSFAFAEQVLLWLVAAVLLGLGMASLAVVNATMVVGAPFDEEMQARKLSLLQLSLPTGQVIGLAAIAALTAADVSFRGRFLSLAAASLVLLAIVAAVNGAPARRLLDAAPPADAPGREPVDVELPRPTFRSILASQFGITLVLVALLMVSAQAIESQYPNYMQGAFDIDPGASASALSLIVLVSIPLYLVAGRWTAAAGATVPFLFSAAARAVAGLGLLLLPTSAGGLALVVFGVIMIVYPMFELNAATLAAITSPIGPGAGQGATGAAMAFGTIVASVLAGWMASEIGYSSLAAITMVAAGAAFALGVLFLRPPSVSDERGADPSIDPGTHARAAPASATSSDDGRR